MDAWLKAGLELLPAARAAKPTTIDAVSRLVALLYSPAFQVEVAQMAMGLTRNELDARVVRNFLKDPCGACEAQRWSASRHVADSCVCASRAPFVASASAAILGARAPAVAQERSGPSRLLRPELPGCGPGP